MSTTERKKTNPYLDSAGKNNLRKDQLVFDQIEAAVTKVPAPRCKASKNLLIFRKTNDKAFHASCKCWTCSTCALLNTRLCAWLIKEGLLDAFKTDTRVRYFVVTSLPEKLTPQEFQARWNKFRRAFMAKGRFETHAEAIEVIEGRPHVNVLTVGGKYIHTSWLNRASSNAGLGGVWVTETGRTKDDARRLAAYVTKGAEETAKWQREGGSGRAQPVRLSRQWKPCGITEGRRQYLKSRGLRIPNRSESMLISTSGRFTILNRASSKSSASSGEDR